MGDLECGVRTHFVGEYGPCVARYPPGSQLPKGFVPVTEQDREQIRAHSFRQTWIGESDLGKLGKARNQLFDSAPSLGQLSRQKKAPTP